LQSDREHLKAEIRRVLDEGEKALNDEPVPVKQQPQQQQPQPSAPSTVQTPAQTKQNESATQSAGTNFFLNSVKGDPPYMAITFHRVQKKFSVTFFEGRRGSVSAASFQKTL